MPKLSSWLAIVLIAVFSGLAGGGLTTWYMLKAPTERLNMLTPVVVLDRAKMIHTLPANATQEQMATTVADWKKLAGKLSAAGYLVIDATAVVAAPDDVYVMPDRM